MLSLTARSISRRTRTLAPSFGVVGQFGSDRHGFLLGLLLSYATLNRLTPFQHLGGFHGVAVPSQGNDCPDRGTVFAYSRLSGMADRQYQHVSVIEDAGRSRCRELSNLDACTNDAVLLPDPHRLLSTSKGLRL